MTPGQYSAECVAYLRRFAASEDPRTNGIRADLKDLARDIHVGVKFALPDGGRLVEQIDPDTDPGALMRLPFPTTVLEFDYLNPEPKSGRGQGYVIVASECIADAARSIKLNVMYQENDVWLPLRGDLIWNPQQSAVRIWADVPGWDAPSASDVRLFVAGCGSVLISFLTVLCCSNVSKERVPANAFQNSKRTKAGKVALYDYWVLTIPGGNSAGPDCGGGHSSPRQHLRRGHVRRIGAGKTTWVNACVVGWGPGVVEKDYRMSL